VPFSFSHIIGNNSQQKILTLRKF